MAFVTLGVTRDISRFLYVFVWVVVRPPHAIGTHKFAG